MPQAAAPAAVPAAEPWSWAVARRMALGRGEEVDCPICFQPCHLKGTKGDRVELLCCSHVFHRCCIASFESFHVFEVHLCPVCRQTYERRPWNEKPRAADHPRKAVEKAAKRPNYRLR